MQGFPFLKTNQRTETRDQDEENKVDLCFMFIHLS
jgi:hypothetical protein